MKKSLKHHYVSLADILANGVVIMIILIVISLSMKQSQQDYDIKQADAVGAVMSRTIASSVVMNKLPSSNPAILHNYNHKRYKNAPLISLYKEFLLINDNGDSKPPLNWRISRDELLTKNNRFDQFLDSLDDKQRKRIRADVGDIKLFYLVMSIIKAHNIRILHWHFEPQQTSQPNANNTVLNIVEIKQKPAEPMPLNTLPTKLDTENKDSVKQQIPSLQNWDFAPIGNSFQLPHKRNDNPKNIAPSLGSQYADALFEAMKNELAQQRGISHQVNALGFIKKLRFSFAGNADRHQFNPLDNTPSQTNQQTDYLFDNNVNKPVEKQLLDLLLQYLSHSQQRYQKHLFVNISMADFMENARQSSSSVYQKEIDAIYHHSNNVLMRQSSLPTHHQKAAKTSVMLTLNDNINHLTLNTPIRPQWFTANHTLSFNLYAQPTINQQTVIELYSTDIILIPYFENIQKNTNQWLAAAVINQQLDNIYLGFVYGKLSDNKILLANDENNIMLNNQHIIDDYDSAQSYHFTIEIILYLLLAISTLLWLIRKT